PPGEGERGGDQAPLAAGEAAELAAQQAGEPEPLAQCGQRERCGVVPANELEYLGDAQHRREGRLLRREANVPSRYRTSRIEAEEARGSRVGDAEAEQHGDRGRL